MIYGYARVSTAGQDHASQVAALRAAGCDRVFAETSSGANTQRRQLARVLATLAAGDTLIVTRLDRLARSSRDALNILAAIGDKRAAFRSLAEPWADTTTPAGRLMVAVLSGLAEFERDLIRGRTGEGQQRAKARGVTFGRPRKLTGRQRRFLVASKAQGVSIGELAGVLGVSRATLHRELLRTDAPAKPGEQIDLEDVLDKRSQSAPSIEQ